MVEVNLYDPHLEDQSKALAAGGRKTTIEYLSEATAAADSGTQVGQNQQAALTDARSKILAGRNTVESLLEGGQKSAAAALESMGR